MLIQYSCYLPLQCYYVPSSRDQTQHGILSCYQTVSYTKTHSSLTVHMPYTPTYKVGWQWHVRMYYTHMYTVYKWACSDTCGLLVGLVNVARLLEQLGCFFQLTGCTVHWKEWLCNILNTSTTLLVLIQNWVPPKIVRCRWIDVICIGSPWVSSETCKLKTLAHRGVIKKCPSQMLACR